MLKGFRDFVMRGNVIDLAVAVIIGASFKTIVDAFIAGILMPLIGTLVGTPNFDNAFVVGNIRFGVVLTAIVNFTLMAGVIYFCLVLPMNTAMARIKRGEAAPPPAPPAPDVLLLTEIRDLLRQQRG